MVFDFPQCSFFLLITPWPLPGLSTFGNIHGFSLFSPGYTWLPCILSSFLVTIIPSYGYVSSQAMYGKTVMCWCLEPNFYYRAAIEAPDFMDFSLVQREPQIFHFCSQFMLVSIMSGPLDLFMPEIWCQLMLKSFSSDLPWGSTSHLEIFQCCSLVVMARCVLGRLIPFCWKYTPKGPLFLFLVIVSSYNRHGFCHGFSFPHICIHLRVYLIIGVNFYDIIVSNKFYNSFSIINMILIIMMMIVVIIIIYIFIVVISRNSSSSSNSSRSVLALRKRFFAKLDKNFNDKGNIIRTNGCTVLLNIYSKLCICYRVN